MSRMPSTGSDLDQPATLWTANSSLDLYKAPYEKRASSTNLSVIDGVTKELNNLGVSDVRQRRDTFPVRLVLFTTNIELHMHVGSPSINPLGPHQLRNSNFKLSTGAGTMVKIKDLYSLSLKAINLTTMLNRPCSHPLFNTRERHDIASQTLRLPRVL